MSNKKLFAVTGNPVLHSKSPNMFNTAFEAMGIDATYFRMAANSAAEAVATFKSLGLAGMNVTAPFKKDIISELDWVHEDALLIGGVNTVVNDNGVLRGYNTDHFGVAQSLIDAGIKLIDTKCIVVGAGGAGLAAAFGLINKGADVTIVNRTVEKAVEAARKFGCKSAGLDALPTLMKENTVIVLSLSQNVNPLDESWIEPHHIIFDANYQSSPFNEAARQKGCNIIQGLDWLLNQAIPAFRLFLGIDPDIAAMRQGLLDNRIQKRCNTISMIGFMASGKTANSRLLSKKMNIEFIDTDARIAEIEGKTVSEIFAENGEAYFRELENKVLKSLVDSPEKHIISTGGGMLTNDDNREIIKSKTLVVWMYARPEAIVRRVKPHTRPLLDVSDPLSKAKELFEARLDYYAQTADILINSEFGTKDEITQKIYDEISKTFGN